ncbi:aminotransferase-like domain-containing protein [Microlunatus soli]|uniref:DNA-binding transcriptional regulator, MocR family, contains an aminotransferase domain n=1 Tax=Microlunatus soli TaxID=630515 RepID=A0A1H1PTS6_9ACTN|nr:PLP-dependent aminotransferase family protein [Microlunatus soli]SDS14129.1 DNA-binding transcriptional regulator, MocR family, contains an aminotransferase domain [Microlunatus soli]
MRIGAEELAVALLGAGAATGPLYLRLASGIVDLVGRGELLPGCRLPSERLLAEQALVSRTTVVAAYRHLQDAGVVERREGSGTRIAAPEVGPGRETVTASRPGAGRAAAYLFGPPSTIDLATAALPGLPMVAEEAARTDQDEYRMLIAENHAYDPRGLLALRRRLAELYSSRGMPTDEHQILITAGAQQAIEVVTSGCVQPGDPVILEQPAYRGALEAFARAGCKVDAVRCDADGMVMADLDAALRNRPARMIYLQSEVQNPTGVRLSPGRRARLLQLAAQHGSIVVDDTSLAETTFVSDGLPALSSDRVPLISIGSLNKLFWSGLRIGWIRASADVISQLARLKGLADFGTSVISQQVAVRLLDRIDQARVERQQGLRESLEIATGLLGRLLPGWSWWEPKGGPSLWVEIPRGDSSQFASAAMRFGVAVLPAAAFSARGLVSRHLRLPFALPEGRLIPGIERLARAWTDYEEHGPVDLPLHSIST